MQTEFDIPLRTIWKGSRDSMTNFEVTIRTKQDGNRWTMFWGCNNFREAESLTIGVLEKNDGSKWPERYEIIRIDKEYEVDTLR